MSQPFDVLGPPHVLGVLRRLKIPATGLLSPPRIVSLSGPERRAAGIPVSAELFAFAYPSKQEELPYPSH